MMKSLDLTPDRSARHLFGAEMRRYRELAGMTLEALASVVNYGKSSLARWETAESMIPPDLPAALDAAFGTDGIFVKLYGIARHEVHPDKYRRRMQLEQRARVIDEFAGHIIPGLAQTRDYASALFRTCKPMATPDEIEEMLNVRMGRQEFLRSTNPPYLSLILDEAVIRRPIGGPKVMHDQLASLLPLMDTAHTVLQVLPFVHGQHSLMGGSLTVLTQDDGSTAAYEESISTGTLMEDAERVRSCRRAYDLMRSYALSPTSSAALIRDVMEALPT